MYFSGKTNGERAKAIALVTLMILLPWGANQSSPSRLEMRESDLDTGYISNKSWGVSGSNDTGWIVLDATGSDSNNGTPALSDFFMDFAPGAVIDNLTFEVAVNGSDGYWANQPQIAVMDTRPVFWTGADAVT